MYAVSTNQIADIFHFNDNKEYFYNFEKDNIMVSICLKIFQV